MKLDPSFYRHTLLPNLYQAKEVGVDILSKSALLAHFRENESEKLWVCCASAQDIEETAEIVNSMLNKKHDVLATLNIKEDFNYALSTKKLLSVVADLKSAGKNELAAKLHKAIQARQLKNVDDLNQMLWKNDEFKLVHPEKASDKDIKDLSTKAVNYLKNKTEADEDLIKEAVLDFIDQNYFSDPDFKGTKNPSKVLAADLYYKNRGDDLDDLEINSDISEKEVELGMRELKKFI